MSTIQEQIDAIINAIALIRIQNLDTGKRNDQIESLFDAADTLKRVQSITEYLSPEQD